jgi:chromatin segregation and condensation protein Rec8/ScpA/Scc1 (kleisin family)
MNFEDFLPESTNEEETVGGLIDSVEAERSEKIGQTQLYDIITSRKPDWQTIIYDLIASEQLDPWDIDIVVLTNAYFKKILEFEEAEESGQENDLKTFETDFYVSSKVLLAAALLLRIKSEFLLSKHMKNIDEILFGRKEENKYVLQRIEIDENELPVLIPKTPMSRLKKVTLSELMSALNQAIETESRRIRKEVQIKRAKKLSEVDFPTFKRIDLKDRIKQFYARILTLMKKQNAECDKLSKKGHRLGYMDLVGSEREERLACFLPLLHLSNNQKLWLEQEDHLDEIWIFLYDYFDKNRDLFIEVISEMENAISPAGENFINANEDGNSKFADNSEEEKEKTGLEIAREKLEDKRKLAEEARKEIERELGWDLEKIETFSNFSNSKDIQEFENVTKVEEDIKNISNEVLKLEKETKIDDASGFSDE